MKLSKRESEALEMLKHNYRAMIMVEARLDLEADNSNGNNYILKAWHGSIKSVNKDTIKLIRKLEAD